MGTRLFGFILFFMILVSFMGAEAAVCETRSKEFRGLCFRDSNCASICEKEGYLTGRCKGFLLRCTCAKDCASGGSSGGDDGSSDGEGPPDGPATSDME